MSKQNQKLLFKTLVTLTCKIDEKQNKSSLNGKMGNLVRMAKQVLDLKQDKSTLLEELRVLFYKTWGFGCDSNHYFESDSLLLNRVFETRKGMPVSIGSIFLSLADSLGIELGAINFPTQLIICDEYRGVKRYLDPWNGEYINEAQLSKLIEGNLGFGVKLAIEDLDIAQNDQLVERIIQVFKIAFLREGKNVEAFHVVQWSLEREPNNPYEVRDRGLILANMDCLEAAIADFDYFIEQCPDDPSTTVLKEQLAHRATEYSPLH